ncbi:hypothetical protein MMC28_005959 [Mycoblastus sanguinarius]|nr:hypothetical protein [Mycoblastus sanguinarius]
MRRKAGDIIVISSDEDGPSTVRKRPKIDASKVICKCEPAQHHLISNFCTVCEGNVSEIKKQTAETRYGNLRPNPVGAISHGEFRSRPQPKENSKPTQKPAAPKRKKPNAPESKCKCEPAEQHLSNEFCISCGLKVDAAKKYVAGLRYSRPHPRTLGAISIGVPGFSSSSLRTQPRYAPIPTTNPPPSKRQEINASRPAGRAF